MLKHLKLTNLGPAPKMELDFGKRLNIITGDNGLGKSFLLDVSWWALTRKWPAEVNPKLTSGKMATPAQNLEGEIDFTFIGPGKPEEYISYFSREDQAWTGRAGRPSNPGLVLYAMSDGSFSVWDPARNYWKRTPDGRDIQDRPSAYVFSPNQVWDGLPGTEGKMLCNGLIQDWAGWQKENGEAFNNLKSVLNVLSASETEKLEPGELTRISLDDVRDIPTIKMPHGQEVPVVYASSGVRRIIALAYFLVWAVQEHQKASQILGKKTSNQITFLIDEIESHLHPSWQRQIIPSLLEVMKSLAHNAKVQLITATHSPMIMASLEPIFDEKQDAWFDLDYVDNKVELTKRDFEKHGNVTSWLISEAFDLKSARPLQYEKLIERASKLLETKTPDLDEIKATHQELLKALNSKDDFLFRWRYIAKKKGWLE